MWWPMCTSFGEAGTMGQMDCVYSYWVTRRDEGFGAQGLAALRDLVPVLGLAIKSAAQADIAKTLGRVYLGRDAAEQVLRGRYRARRHRAHQHGAVVLRPARLDRDQREHRARRDHPVPQRLCAGLDRRHPRGRRRGAEADRRRRAGDVHPREHGGGKTRRAARRTSLPPQHEARSPPAAPPRAAR